MGLVSILVVALLVYAFASRRRLRWALKRMVVAGDVPSRPVDASTEALARQHFASIPCPCKRSFTALEPRSTTVLFAGETRLVLRAECASCTESRTRYYRCE